jgi:cytochrome c oxidase subunit IV
MKSAQLETARYHVYPAHIYLGVHVSLSTSTLNFLFERNELEGLLRWPKKIILINRVKFRVIFYINNLFYIQEYCSSKYFVAGVDGHASFIRPCLAYT